MWVGKTSCWTVLCLLLLSPLLLELRARVHQTSRRERGRQGKVRPRTSTWPNSCARSQAQTFIKSYGSYGKEPNKILSPRPTDNFLLTNIAHHPSHIFTTRTERTEPLSSSFHLLWTNASPLEIETLAGFPNVIVQKDPGRRRDGRTGRNRLVGPSASILRYYMHRFSALWVQGPFVLFGGDGSAALHISAIVRWRKDCRLVARQGRRFLCGSFSVVDRPMRPQGVLSCTMSHDVCATSFVVCLSKHTGKRKGLSSLAAYKPALVAAGLTQFSIHRITYPSYSLKTQPPATMTATVDLPCFTLNTKGMGDDLVKKLLAQHAFRLRDDESKEFQSVWWKQVRHVNACSVWETVPRNVLESSDSTNVSDGMIRIEGLVGLFGRDIPPWILGKFKNDDKKLAQYFQNPTVSDSVSLVDALGFH